MYKAEQQARKAVEDAKARLAKADCAVTKHYAEVDLKECEKDLKRVLAEVTTY